LKKQKRLIKRSVRRHIRQGYKFAIHVPRTVEETLMFDKENGNTLWYDAILKEAGKLRVVFDMFGTGGEATSWL
jgi:hypothetical protein